MTKPGTIRRKTPLGPDPPENPASYQPATGSGRPRPEPQTHHEEFRLRLLGRNVCGPFHRRRCSPYRSPDRRRSSEGWSDHALALRGEHYPGHELRSPQLDLDQRLQHAAVEDAGGRRHLHRGVHARRGDHHGRGSVEWLWCGRGSGATHAGLRFECQSGGRSHGGRAPGITGGHGGQHAPQRFRGQPDQRERHRLVRHGAGRGDQGSQRDAVWRQRGGRVDQHQLQARQIRPGRTAANQRLHYVAN